MSQFSSIGFVNFSSAKQPRLENPDALESSMSSWFSIQGIQNANKKHAKKGSQNHKKCELKEKSQSGVGQAA